MIIKSKAGAKKIIRLKECYDCVEHYTNLGNCLGSVNGCKLNPRPPKMTVPRYEINFFDKDHNVKSVEEVWRLLRAK